MRVEEQDNNAESSEGEDEENYERGYESDEDENIEEPHGIKGMTL